MKKLLMLLQNQNNLADSIRHHMSFPGLLVACLLTTLLTSCADPISTQPETVQPETVQPETVQPETVQPETTQPETTQPDATQLVPQSSHESTDIFEQLKTDDFDLADPANCEYDNHDLTAEQAGIADELFDGNQNHGTPGTAKLQNQGLLPDLSWVPTGARKYPVRAECSAEVLEELLLQTGPNPHEQRDRIASYFQKCGNDLTYGEPSNAEGLIKFRTIRYDVCRHPRLRKVSIRLPDGQIIRGFLGMKPGAHKRPLIIIKCGVFCNAGDPSQRYQIMHLFDESPFNILALANVTGSEFTQDNKYMALGGLYEGMQVLKVARMVMRLPLRHYVSSLHFAGVSLGSQSGLFAAYMNSFASPIDMVANNDANEGAVASPKLRSVLAMCGVAELQPSLEKLFEPGIKGQFVRMYFTAELDKIRAAVPFLKDLLPDPGNTEVARVPSTIADGALEYFRHVGSNWGLPPFENQHIRNRDEFWAANSFSAMTRGQLIRTPTLLFTADDDWIVDTSVNADQVQRTRHPSADNLLEVISVPKGNHCAFSSFYGWDVISSLYRNYLLSRSPELLARRHFETAPIRKALLPRVIRGWPAEHISQEFKAVAGNPAFEVRFRLWRGFRLKRCKRERINTSEDVCYVTAIARIPYDEIGASWAVMPHTEPEAEALTRWMNVNLHALDTDGRPLRPGYETNVTQLRWVSYEP